ncbi:hypothetical protein OH76DRAFT_514724 [Lentinus brumalis]|uniref:Uncharacterized protein n=1 Tax=Lentinus brumalis TaxID=2498619 RepID=A0A371DBI7_9APHY|nr:hypothetical protein OH76DRAFT_514724 [Polyporus brumalis]
MWNASANGRDRGDAACTGSEQAPTRGAAAEPRLRLEPRRGSTRIDLLDACVRVISIVAMDCNLAADIAVCGDGTRDGESPGARGSGRAPGWDDGCGGLDGNGDRKRMGCWSGGREAWWSAEGDRTSGRE